MFSLPALTTQQKLYVFAVIAVIVLFVSGLIVQQNLGYNSTENWQIHQSITGHVSVIDKPGYYLNLFGQVWTYPRFVEYHFTSDSRPESPEDESIRVTFNDGGTAQVDAYVKIKTPSLEPERIQFHQLFRASPLSIRDSIEAHLVNCVKAAGPIMSSTENQASRKAEFNQVVEEMLSAGLYVMERRIVVLQDSVIANEKQKSTAEAVSGQEAPEPNEPIKVVATEAVIDPTTGRPKIAKASPLTRYGMQVEQFSILDTDYDTKTLEQFAAKKESYLLAEKAKAEQQRAVQEKLRIRAEGESLVEQIRQEGEKEKMKAVVSAEKEAEVAELTKKKAVTEAQQKVEVAQQEQSEAETRKSIAAIAAETAELNKAAEISAAEAKQKSIEIGGALTEAQRLLATLQKERDIGVAEHLSKIATPGVVIAGNGSSEDGAGAGLQNNLMNLTLLRALGIIDGSNGSKVFQPAATHK